MTERLADVPRWLLLVAIIYAPWAYGCTEERAIRGLNILMVVITALWALGCAVRRKKPMINVACLVCVILMLGQGWLVTLNAQYHCDPWTLEFSPIPSFWKSGPGTIDQPLSLPIMFRITGLLGILCFVIDLCQRPRWRMILWWTIAGAGTSIVILGLLERFTQAQMIFWRTPYDNWPWPFFFATYYYHGNAGAFINLILPAVAGLAIISLRREYAHRERAIWIPSLFICVAGAFVNVSKAAMTLTVLSLAILGAWQFRAWRHNRPALARKTLLLYCGIAIIALVAIGSAGWVMAAPRWRAMAADLTTKNERLLVQGACLRVIRDAGWWGFGPGTFSHIFPHYTGYLGNAIAGFWKFAHEDYLQTVIEWGWIGVVFPAVLFLGGIAMGFRNYLNKSSLGLRDQILLFTSSLALLIVALHSLVDFPLQIASLQFYTAILLGLAWGSGTWASKSPPL